VITEEIPTVDVRVITLVSATGIGVFMGALDASIVNISLKTISDWFAVDQSQVQWIVLGYLLTIISLMTISGNLGDKFGSKQVFQGGIVLFTIGSLFCVFSPTLEMLVIARIFQALGASGLFANGIAIITRFTSRKNRGVAIGWNSLIVSGALIVGPAVGGFLTQYFGWQSIFLINIPIGIFGFLWVQITIPPTRPLVKIDNPGVNSKKIDLLGIILFPFSLFAFIGGISILSDENTIEILPYSLLLFFLGILAFVALIFVEKKAPNPNIDLTLFKNRRFVIGIISAIFAFTGLQVIIYQLPFFLQDELTLNLSQSETGFILIFIPLVMAMSGPVAGRLSDKIDARYLSTGGMIGIGGVLFILALILPKTTNILFLVLLMLLFGLAIGFFASPNGNSIMSASPKEKLGLAGGLLGLSRNIGFALGITLSTTVLTLLRRYFSDVNNSTINNPDVYVLAMQWLFLLSLPFIFLAVIISYLRGPEDYSVS
jgi:EmrB/QacA subfamily drug resistance transporter